MRIIILERDPNTTWLITRMLEEHDLILPSSVKDAEIILENERVDLVISGISLNDGSIWNLKDYFEKIPFIVISANPAIDRIDDLLAANVSDYIKKPITKEKLLETIQRVIEEKSREYESDIVILEKKVQDASDKIRENIILKSPFVVIGEPKVGKRTLIKNAAGKLKLKINEGTNLDAGKSSITILDISNLHPSIVEKIVNFEYNTILAFVFDGREEDFFDKAPVNKDILKIIGNRIIEIPPLRERKNEIIPILEVYIKKFNPNIKLNFTPKAKGILLDHNWPGNFAELIEVAEELAKIGKDTIEDYLIPPEIIYGVRYPFIKPLKETVEKLLKEGKANIYDEISKIVESIMIKEALKISNYNQSVAAKKLGLHRNTIRYKIRELNIIIGKGGVDEDS